MNSNSIIYDNTYILGIYYEDYKKQFININESFNENDFKAISEYIKKNAPI